MNKLHVDGLERANLDASPQDSRFTGTLASFSAAKGSGRIITDNGGGNYHVYREQLLESGLKFILSPQKLTYILMGQDGRKGYRAAAIELAGKRITASVPKGMKWETIVIDEFSPDNRLGTVRMLNTDQVAILHASTIQASGIIIKMQVGTELDAVIDASPRPSSRFSHVARFIRIPAVK